MGMKKHSYVGSSSISSGFSKGEGWGLCKGTRYQDQHLAVHSMPVAVSMRSCRESDERRIIITAEGRRRKRSFASHLADLPEGLEGDSAASASADGDMASPARQRRRSASGDITPSQSFSPVG